jgi:hypothetical protein
MLGTKYYIGIFFSFWVKKSGNPGFSYTQQKCTMDYLFPFPTCFLNEASALNNATKKCQCNVHTRVHIRCERPRVRQISVTGNVSDERQQNSPILTPSLEKKSLQYSKLNL